MLKHLSPDIGAATRRSAPAPALGISLGWFLGLLGALFAAFFVVYAFYAAKGLQGSDWQTFYDAAVRFSHGQPVYTVAYGFYNPPPVLLLVRAFTPLPYIPSRILWGALSTAMLLGSAALTADACGFPTDTRTRFLAAWWILCSAPTMLLVPLTGNLSALILFSLASSFCLFARGKEGWAGAALAVTLVKPQLALFTVPLLLYKRRWRAAIAYGATALAVCAISLPLVGVGLYRQYLNVESQIAGWTSSNYALQLDVPGIHGMFLQRWPHSSLAETASNVCYLAVVLALLWYWRGPWRPQSSHFAGGWALLVLGTLLTTPYAHSYDLVLLVLPMVVLYVRSVQRASRWDRAVLIVLYVAPFLVLLFRQHFMVPALTLAVLTLLWSARQGAAQRVETDQFPVAL